MHVKGKARTARNTGFLTNEYGEVVDSPQDMCEELDNFLDQYLLKRS